MSSCAHENYPALREAKNSQLVFAITIIIKLLKTVNMHQTITVSVPIEIKEIIREKAKQADLSMTDFILKSALDKQIVGPHEKEKFLVIRDLTRDMNKIGVNINQLTERVNALAKANKVLLPETALKIQTEISKLNQLYEEIFAVLLKVG